MTSTDPHHDRVTAAAEAIAARGENPTLSAVRAELGGGSFSTISPALRAWKAQRAHTDAPVGEPLPEPLQAAAAAGATQIWTTALELAAERLSAERTALDAARAEADAAVAEATATADELAAQLEAAQSAAQTAAEQHAAAETELRDALEAEQARARAAEKRQAVAEAVAEERQIEIDRAQARHRDLVARLEPAPTEEARKSTS